MELDAADLALRDDIVRERDKTIAAIRAEAARAAERLDALEDQRIEELARYVVERVAGRGPEVGS
jgi:hypothetical protein